MWACWIGSFGPAFAGDLGLRESARTDVRGDSVSSGFAECIPCTFAVAVWLILAAEWLTLPANLIPKEL